MGCLTLWCTALKMTPLTDTAKGSRVAEGFRRTKEKFRLSTTAPKSDTLISRVPVSCRQTPVRAVLEVRSVTVRLLPTEDLVRMPVMPWMVIVGEHALRSDTLLTRLTQFTLVKLWSST